MKRSIKFITAVLAILLTACTSEVERVFDESSAQHIANAISTDKEVLCAADNGWIMQYYPYAGADNSSHPNYGGFNVLLKFTTDGHVTVATELASADTTATSTYKIEQSEGVLLSFDTYNELFHYFSDPLNPDGIGDKGYGMEGDFEFRVKSATAEKVVMEGRKHKSTIIMTPLDDDTDWAEYLTEIAVVKDNIDFASYNYMVNGDTMGASKSYNTFTIAYVDDEGNDQDEVVPFIVTTTGLSLYDTLTIGGVSVKEFTYQDNGTYRVVSNENSDVYFQGVVKPLNEVLNSGDAYWYLSYANLGTTGQTAINNVNTGLIANLGSDWGLQYVEFLGDIYYIRINGYWAAYTFSPTLSGDDQLTLTQTGYGGSSAQQSNAKYFEKYSSTFTQIYSFFNGHTFTVTADNNRYPSVLTLTDNSDANNTIILTTSAVSVY